MIDILMTIAFRDTHISDIDSAKLGAVQFGTERRLLRCSTER